jgi:hypothetical protein
MHGQNALSGAHFDEWVADYTGFQAGSPNPSVFHTPELCKGQQQEMQAAQSRRAASQLRWAQMVPAVRYQGDAEVGLGRKAGASHCTLLALAPPAAMHIMQRVNLGQ